jgi:hypothetical protein
MQHDVESRTFWVEESKLREFVDLPDDWQIQSPSAELTWPGGQRPGVAGTRVAMLRFTRRNKASRITGR